LRHFTTADGARIAYADEGAGRPLVLLHGLMAHKGFFARQAELADTFRLISVDLRGHGDSRADGTALTSIAQLARDVSDLADALELEDAIGIGWSLGASVLWRVLTGPAAPRFAGAVVVDMTARVMNDESWTLGLTPDACDARSAAMRDNFANFSSAAGQNIFAQPVTAERREIADWASAEFARNDPAMIGAIWASLMAEDFRPTLRRIQHPTLIVHGAHSQLYGAGTAEHLAETLPDARIVRFDQSGHAPQLEQPELFNQILRDFAAGLPRTRQVEETNS